MTRRTEYGSLTHTLRVAFGDDVSQTSPFRPPYPCVCTPSQVLLRSTGFEREFIRRHSWYEREEETAVRLAHPIPFTWCGSSWCTVATFLKRRLVKLRHGFCYGKHVLLFVRVSNTLCMSCLLSILTFHHFSNSHACNASFRILENFWREIQKFEFRR